MFTIHRGYSLMAAQSDARARILATNITNAHNFCAPASYTNRTSGYFDEGPSRK